MTATITYRKTKQGEWVAYGPASSMPCAGAFVTVTKASGERKQETVERLGKPFTVNGAQMVYGYLARTPRASASGHSHTSASGSRCDECGRNGARYRRYDSSGIAGTVCTTCNREPDYALSFA